MNNLGSEMLDSLVGRAKEIAVLGEVYDSRKAEFVAVYGRRRIGKTFLVDQFVVVK